jgi:hypothetical protein
VENQLKNLNRTLDKQISSTPVFTKNDEQNILLAIRNSSTKKTEKPKVKNTFVPRLLTAALFAGVIFTSYTLIDSYLTPETATEIEKKPEIRYAQELSQASSMISYDENTNILKINGSVKNTTEFNSEKFQTNIKILNEELQAAIGSKTLEIDETPQQGYLMPDEPFIFTKEITLDKPISESALKDALQIEVYTETKTLTSFIISDIKFTGKKAEEPVVDTEQPVIEENEKENEEKDSSSTTEKEKTEQDTRDSVIEESPEPTHSLDNLEEQYGKKKTPFNSVEVAKEDGYFSIKGITIGTTLDQALRILGPYDKHSEPELHAPIYATWNLQTPLKANESTGLFVELTELKKDKKIEYLSFNTGDKAYVEKLIAQLGQPYSEGTNIKFYYSEKSKQMLIINNQDSYYSVSLQYEPNLNPYKNETN